MSLFLDGNISTIEDLRAYDSSILTVANVEQVDLDAKLRLAERELQVELQQALARSSANRVTPAAVDLTALVVTEPLHQWHCLRTLAMVYRDAYYSQLNDRYHGRWREYLSLDARTSALLFSTGLGMAGDPIRQSAVPRIVVEAGSNEPATYYVRVAWLNSSQQEGQGSATSAIIADQFHTLTITALNPPANAVSWNLYIGNVDSALTRQNAVPLGLGQSWILPANGLAEGPPPSEGQSPDYFFSLSQVLPRG